MVDFDDSNMFPDPRVQARGMAELADLRDCFVLARAWGDPTLFGTLAAARLLPSLRARAGVRANIRCALAGRAVPDRSPILWNDRNFRANCGALILPKPGEPYAPPPEDWDEKVHLQANWRCDPRSAVCLVKFLKLAAARQVPVYWVLPPLRPRVQAKRDKLGLDAVFSQFVRKAMARFPNLVVIDARSAGFVDAMFADAGHLNREGARALSEGVAEVLARTPAGDSNGSRWVSLTRVNPKGVGEAPLEDLNQSILAVSKLPEGRR